MCAHFMLWEQFIGPSLKAMRRLLIKPIQSWGNTASLSYPDTLVRKPDCLHLPYNNTIEIWTKDFTMTLAGVTHVVGALSGGPKGYRFILSQAHT